MQESTQSTEGCNEEFLHGNVKIMTTLVGERPGAKSGLLESRISEPTENVNICILRGTTWVWRKGKVDLMWVPHLESERFLKNDY